LGDCLLGVYFKILLEYFEQKLSKKIKFSSHYYFMVYVKNLLKICDCQKNSNLFTSFLLLKNTNYNIFKIFLGIFHSLD